MKVRRSEAKEERVFVKHKRLKGVTKKVGVAKGFGPRHAENAKEGESDPSSLAWNEAKFGVDAKLTPHEAVLNRNAAELAGRQNIKRLNAQGNKLAKKGVDLASGGGKSMKEKKQKLAEGGYAGDWQGGPAKRKQPGYAGDWQGGPLGRPEMQRPAPQGGMDAILAGRPNFTASQWYNPAQGAWQARRPQETPFAGGAPPSPGVPPGGMPPAYGGGGGLPNNFGVGGGFYPPEQGPFAQNKVFRGQAGTTDVQPIGTPAQGQVYGPPIQLSAPDILSKLQAAGKEQGLSSAQINGLMNAFKGGSQAFNTGGGMGPTTDVSGGYYGLSQSPGGYQGGISDIGYPPFVAPNADYHGDKGGWQGRYDPNYFIPNYG